MSTAVKDICVVGADSAGHLIPALSLALQWKKRHPAAKIIICSGNKSLESKIINNYSVDAALKISGVGMPSSLFGYARCLYRLIKAYIQALFFLHKYRPHHVVSTGGLLSVPVVVAAWTLGIHSDIYEFNAVPGKATRLLAYIVQDIKISFAECQRFWAGSAREHKCTIAPYPVRFKDQPQAISSPQRLSSFDDSRRTLFIMGGSQGSLFLNNMWYDFIQKNHKIASSLQVIHQTGSNDTRDWPSVYSARGIPAYVFSYDHDFSLLYRTADYIISRGGAGALFEIAFFKKRALIIPLETPQTSHQVDNARAMQQKHPDLFTILPASKVDSAFQNTFLDHFWWDINAKKMQQCWRNVC